MPPPTERPLSEAELLVAAARLAEEHSVAVQRVARMEADMGALVAASLDSNADDEHDPEGPTIAYERSQLATLTQQARRHLAETEAAMERFEIGGYGVCEVCGAPTGAARLEARPSARTCIQHAGALP